MRIDVVGDESISRQARTYAEYRLFAALSEVVDSRRVTSASLALRGARTRRQSDTVVCTVAVELRDGETIRLKASGEHPYAAINRAADRLRLSARPTRHEASHAALVAIE